MTNLGNEQLINIATMLLIGFVVMLLGAIFNMVAIKDSRSNLSDNCMAMSIDYYGLSCLEHIQAMKKDASGFAVDDKVFTDALQEALLDDISKDEYKKLKRIFADLKSDNEQVWQDRKNTQILDDLRNS